MFTFSKNNLFHTQLFITFSKKCFLEQRIISLLSRWDPDSVPLTYWSASYWHKVAKSYLSCGRANNCFSAFARRNLEKISFLTVLGRTHPKPVIFLKSQEPPVSLGINQLIYIGVCSMFLCLTQAISWSSFTRWHQELHSWQCTQHCPRNRGLAAQQL